MNSRAAAQSLNALVDHLRTRRDAILENWRRLVDNDPLLTTAGALPKVQFYDHIPALDSRLLSRPSVDDTGHFETADLGLGVVGNRPQVHAHFGASDRPLGLGHGTIV